MNKDGLVCVCVCHRYKDEMCESQEDFTRSIQDLTNMVTNFSQLSDLAKMDHITAEVRVHAHTHTHIYTTLCVSSHAFAGAFARNSDMDCVTRVKNNTRMN